MQARGSTPERASGTARYGLRWHARDTARRARFWLERASVPQLIGAFYVAAGPVLFAVGWAALTLNSWWVWVPGPSMFAAGTVLLAQESLRRRR